MRLVLVLVVLRQPGVQARHGGTGAGGLPHGLRVLPLQLLQRMLLLVHQQLLALLVELPPLLLLVQAVAARPLLSIKALDLLQLGALQEERKDQ